MFLRGQSIKIYSLVADITRKHNFLIPDRKYIKDDEVSEKYEGATVLDPNIGLYLDIPVSVLDFASLYPSSMIAENISHDSIIGYKEYRIKPKKRETEPDEYELVKDTINDKYNNFIPQMYNQAQKGGLNLD